MLSMLKEINRHLNFIDSDTDAFLPYGKFAGRGQWRNLVDKANALISPVEDPVYIASVPELEEGGLPSVVDQAFGDEEVQVGVCRGFNTALNGMEWHDCAEIIVAANPLVLLLGLQDEVEDGEWNTRNAKACYLHGGDAVILNPGTLHLAPCRPGSRPFLSLILLARGVNGELEAGEGTETDLRDAAEGVREGGDDPHLWMHRKWLLVHPDSPQAEKGAPIGLKGPNLVLNTL